MELTNYDELIKAIYAEDYKNIDILLKTINTNYYGAVVYRRPVRDDNVFLMSYMLNHETQQITQETIRAIYKMAVRYNRPIIMYVLGGYLKLNERCE